MKILEKLKERKEKKKKFWEDTTSVFGSFKMEIKKCIDWINALPLFEKIITVFMIISVLVLCIGVLMSYTVLIKIGFICIGIIFATLIIIIIKLALQVSKIKKGATK